jgi:hypothetical protein
VIAGLKKTNLVEGLRRQVEAVKAGLAIVEQDVPVTGCFCFINPEGQAGGSGWRCSEPSASKASRSLTHAGCRSA